ncbi:hypothetical protein F5Y15DRAFT_285308 [Xylariaceae sp. FL0016]|nr:hypothetical protein F5Y15DRAFT_285308 [Xylariaceae sp. FL0016]
MLNSPSVSVLGPDPAHRRCVLNGNAFQQDAIQSFNNWQYACFYSPLPGAEEPLYVHLSRRKLSQGSWETLVFEDYPQTTDDGHNTVQLGICPGDGSLHLSYDHHCDVLRYRHSIPGVALSPEHHPWSPRLFTATLSQLPGLSSSPQVDTLLSYITYPRFVALAPKSLLFTFRTGKAGLGDDHLALYTPAPSPPHPTAEEDAEGKAPPPSTGAGTGTYALLGTHLKGVANNPYIHGLDVDSRGTLHATWVYRGFVPYPGWDDPLDTQHKAQAGPNGAENNHDICYAASPDGGRSWRNSDGDVVVADLLGGDGESVTPDARGITVFAIPKGSGLTNQEAQAVDGRGGVHVLNRDSTGGDGVVRWKHYYRSPEGSWHQRPLPVPAVYGGKRGQVAVSQTDDLYFVLPSHSEPDALEILKASKESRYAEYESVWRGDGFLPTEPLLDKARMQHDNVLSVFTRAPSAVRTGTGVDVVVLDFKL